MKSCSLPCFDCPFSRFTTELIDNPEDFFDRHMTPGTDGEDGFEPFECEEQGGICFGQMTMLVNMDAKFQLSPFSELLDELRLYHKDRNNFFVFGIEFVVYHMHGPEIGRHWATPISQAEVRSKIDEADAGGEIHRG